MLLQIIAVHCRARADVVKLDCVYEKQESDFQPFSLSSPEGEEAQEVPAADDHAGSVVAGVEADERDIAQVRIYVVPDPVPVFKKLFRGGVRQVHVVDQSECADGAGVCPEAAHQPFRRSERQLALSQLFLKCVNVKSLMAFHGHKIVAVALVIPEEQVLAVCRLRNLSPVLQTLFD